MLLGYFIEMKTLRKSNRASIGTARKPGIRRHRATISARNGSRRRAYSRLRASVGRGARIRPGADGASAQAAQKQRIDARYQAAVKSFETAARAFRKQNYKKAKEILEKLVNGEVREVAERARIHLRLCEQKLSRPAPPPRGAEDFYNLGVAALNARDLWAAIESLSKADKLKPNQEHVRYALAAARALQGNADAALEDLKVALTLRPANRIQARYDEDFQGLAGDPRFRRLVYQEASQAS
jgi:tetratricopeptide (TPR) repeat protein